MSRPGFDPQRSSLLVGEVAGRHHTGPIRGGPSLELSRDHNVQPSRDTGGVAPCSEDPSRTCHHVDPTADWYKDAREKKLRALQRPSRGDSGFKGALDEQEDNGLLAPELALAISRVKGVKRWTRASAGALNKFPRQPISAE
jgi:hypothetical protein